MPPYDLMGLLLERILPVTDQDGASADFSWQTNPRRPH